MSETTTCPPKLVLVDGDPVLGMDAIKAMKRQWEKDSSGCLRWVDASAPTGKKNPGEFLNFLDGESSTSDWGGEHKVVMLRGISNTKQFRDALGQICQSVSDGNTLLVFDETGVIKGDGKKDNKGNVQQNGWSAIREMFSDKGVIAEVPPPFKNLGPIPWGERFCVEQVKAVVSEMAKRGKKISHGVVREVFLERVMPDWSYILIDLDKLADLVESETITENDVTSIVFPWAQNHAIYEFSEAFNSGNFDRIMESYDELTAGKVHYEVLFSFSMKILRWQMIAAHLMSYGQPLPEALLSIAGRMNRKDANNATEKLRALKPRMFKAADPKSENKDETKDDGITPFMAKGVCKFVKDVLPGKVPIKSGALGTYPFVDVVMSRYLTMATCLENVRIGGAGVARQEFKNAMFKVCGNKGK